MGNKKLNLWAVVVLKWIKSRTELVEGEDVKCLNWLRILIDLWIGDMWAITDFRQFGVVYGAEFFGKVFCDKHKTVTGEVKTFRKFFMQTILRLD